MTPGLSITSALPESQTWCAIPVYNNAATIVDVARRARRSLRKWSWWTMAATMPICGNFSRMLT